MTPKVFPIRTLVYPVYFSWTSANPGAASGATPFLPIYRMDVTDPNTGDPQLVDLRALKPNQGLAIVSMTLSAREDSTLGFGSEDWPSVPFVRGTFLKGGGITLQPQIPIYLKPGKRLQGYYLSGTGAGAGADYFGHGFIYEGTD